MCRGKKIKIIIFEWRFRGSQSTYEADQRKFLENDVLHEYLARKAPNLIRLEERCYTLYDVSCNHIYFVNDPYLK